MCLIWWAYDVQPFSIFSMINLSMFSDSIQKNQIETAMSEIEAHSCVRFMEIPEDRQEPDFIYIGNPGNYPG